MAVDMVIRHYPCDNSNYQSVPEIHVYDKANVAKCALGQSRIPPRTQGRNEGWQWKSFGNDYKDYMQISHQPKPMQNTRTLKPEGLRETSMPSCPTPIIHESLLLTGTFTPRPPHRRHRRHPSRRPWPSSSSHGQGDRHRRARSVRSRCASGNQDGQ